MLVKATLWSFFSWIVMLLFTYYLLMLVNLIVGMEFCEESHVFNIVPVLESSTGATIRFALAMLFSCSYFIDYCIFFIRALFYVEY